MKILNWPLGSGKTTQLVKMMLEPGNEDVIYIAPTMEQAHQNAYRVALSLGAPASEELKKRFTSIAYIVAIRSISRGGHEPRFVVDEFEWVLSHLLRGRILAVAGIDESEYIEYKADPVAYSNKNYMERR